MDILGVALVAAAKRRLLPPKRDWLSEWIGGIVVFVSLQTAEPVQPRAEDKSEPAPSAPDFAEDSLRLVLDTTPGLIHTSQPDGSVDSFNRRWLDYLGVRLDEIKGWGWISKIHPEDGEAFVEKWKRSLRTGEPLEAEARVRRNDGVYRWMIHRKVPLRDEHGTIVRWYGSSIDIDDRKKAEDALRLSEFYLAEGQRLGHAGSWAFKPDLTCDYWSRELYEILGFDPRNGIPTIPDYFTRVHPEDRAVVEATIQRMIRAGEGCDLKKRIIRPDGVQRVIRCVGMPVRENGVVTRFVGTLMDITEQEEAQEAIRRSEAFLAEGQRLSHTGSWGWNALTGKLTWSAEHFRILGLDPKETNASLELFWERVHPDDRTDVQRAFEFAIRDKKDFELEFRIVTPDWSIRHLHGVGHAVLNEANELVEFIGSTMDITERKRAEERARSQQEAMRLALNAFVEELDVNRFLGDVIAELNKQFHAKSWELWLFDEAINASLLHSSNYSRETFSAELDSKNARPHDDFQAIWQSEAAARAPQVVQLSTGKSLLCGQRCELLKARGIKTLMVVPLALGEQSLGFLELQFESPTQFTADDLDLAQALVNHATLALQLNRLTRRAEQLAVTEERNRLAREIHDTLAQAFAGIVLHSEALGASLACNKKRSANALSHIQKLARSGLDEARRSVQALRPKALEGSTLAAALEQAAKRLAETRKLSCQFRQKGETRMLSLEAQNELFRIAQEALTNVSKHSQAKSVWINLSFTAKQVALTIRDNGVGLVATTSKEPKRGYGLATMRERAQNIGGELDVQSPKSGGASVRVRVPLAAPEKSINRHT